jgi:hypothetical protein
MRCGKAQQWLSLDLDNGLPPDRVIALEHHLAACGGCRAYRDDLLLGRRILKATAPQLSDNFEWRLRLRLNRTLEEAARLAPAPWEESAGRAAAWWRNFGVASAVGLAAALTVAIFAWPLEGPSFRAGGGVATSDFEHLVPVADGGRTGGEVAGLIPSDRRPLWGLGDRSGGWQRVVDGGSAGRNGADGQFLSGWSGRSVSDLQTINALRLENDRLDTMLRQYQQQLRSYKAQLDTTREDHLDTERTE